MKIVISENQLRFIAEKMTDVDERARTLANTRKKRLFPKSAMMSNPDRFKKYDLEKRDLGEQPVSDEHAKWVEKFNEGGKFITCPNCRNKFTQTTHKKKKSLPICPNCGTHVQQKKED